MTLADGLQVLLRDVGAYSRILLPAYRLRDYQLAPARAIVESVTARLGRQFAVVFSRQAGKDELLAHLIAWLLTRYQVAGGTIVVAAPTRTPQANITRDRLLDRLQRSALTAGKVRTRDGYIVEVGQASARFLSADEGANPRGQTASLLLVANEAQDIDPAIWDARFDPMAASTNATTVFMGTVWDKVGLLHRQMEHLARLEVEMSGSRGVEEKIGRTSRLHDSCQRQRSPRLVPCALAGSRRGAPRVWRSCPGAHRPVRREPPVHPHRIHARGPRRRGRALPPATGDPVAGGAPAAAPGGTGEALRGALTIIEVEAGGRELPLYRVVDRMAWTGTKHVALHDQLVDLARNVWKLSALVVDATGVGAGLASFLADQLGKGPRRVIVEPFVFTGKSKSDLGWAFVGLIDGGRIKEYADDGSDITRIYRHQLAACTFEVLPGPGKLLRWSVPASRGHDDLLISTALTARLDAIDWRDRTARGSTAP
jgi:hypothetical protein